VENLAERIIKPIDIKILEPIKKATTVDVGPFIFDFATGDFTLKTGGKLPFWELNKKEIGDFIVKSKLRALSETEQKKFTQRTEYTPEAMMFAEADFRSDVFERLRGIPVWIAGIPPPPEAGGKMRPHLHLDGKIYMLSAEQWADFTKVAIEKLSKNIATVNKISFDKFITAAEIVAETI
jgi:hypothetical protein